MKNTTIRIASLSAAISSVAFGQKVDTGRGPVEWPAEAKEQFRVRMDERRKELANDKDGWDDVWVLLFSSPKDGGTAYKIPFNDRKKDTDADGRTDYEEMLVYSDPTYRERPSTSEEEIARVKAAENQAKDGKASRAALQATARQISGPWLHQEVPSMVPGKPFSIEEMRKEKRLRLGNKVAAIALRQQQKVLAGRAAATQLGFAHRFQTPNGGDAVLSGLRNGFPEYHFTRNAISADSISTDGLWPGGLSNLNLSGLPSDAPQVRLGVWDPGDVLVGHTEFSITGGSRVTDMDGASATANHATHVTGTMSARGANAAAHGMAYSAAVHSRDSTNDIAEMADIFGNILVTDDFFVSNHSYGPNPGWTSFQVAQATNFVYFNVNTNQFSTITVQPGLYGAWAGNPALSQTEDNFFGLYWQGLSDELDEIAYDSETLLPVWAAGNDRGDPTTVDHFANDVQFGIVVTNRVRPVDGGAAGFDSMPPDSVAKNILTIGSIPDLVGGWVSGSNPAMSTFSDFGPTDDGRIKPDVCANGEGITSSAANGSYVVFSGTSQAAPAVAGTLGLLVELLQRYRGPDYEPPAPLLKGLLIHTADDIRNAGPDYQSGWGLVNARKAAELVNVNEVSGNGNNLRMVTVQNGAAQTIPVKAIGGTPIRVTVVWMDVPGTPPGDLLDPVALMLVNDVDTSITTSGAGPFRPFVLNPALPANVATTGINNRDNVEQVVVSAPVANQTYNIVIGPAAGETFENDLGQASPQTVALIISGIQQAPLQEFRIVYFQETADDKYTAIWPAVIGSTYRVQSSLDLSTGTWTDVTGDIIANLQYVAVEIARNGAEPSRFWRARKVQ